MQLQRETLGLYKQLVKTLVHNERKTRLARAIKENKKQIGLLTYRKSQIVRRQQALNEGITDPGLIQEMNNLNRQVDHLKSIDPAKDKKLLFLVDSTPLRIMWEDNLLKSPKNAKELARRLEHIKDIIDFTKNQSQYQNLMALYNLGTGITQEEKVKRTANKVGLDVPF
ncbi:hypothetical protein NCAS_0B06300 [Naumovozyma castellii]|uniref:Uncharacterized protein n=1 Tax=Naumovozyma castellii TaxID=27288 RepID=G0V9U7_NAUCA|nr:hypothetical protein NCAS_0B06300 [Naumovozyma castellii CBS 4309]CCC68714.1 hypothetical protein NCAS_0B06300 [Naumovozyma castellii CBS 4309]